MTPVEFLTARWDEFEALARSANGPHWRHGEGHMSRGEVYCSGGAAYQRDEAWAIGWFTPGAPLSRTQGDANARHSAANDPAYVLADIAAKRAVVEWVVQVQAIAGEPPAFDPDSAAALTHVVLLLCLPFADHPDYQKEWAQP